MLRRGMMRFTFDHIAISAETLQAGQAYVEQALDVPLQPGGEHAVFHTHNALLGLAEGLYLEAIAVNPAAPVPERPRWFDLDRFIGAPRVTNWVCAVPDLDRALRMVDLDLGQPVDLQRGDLRWRMAVPETGVLPFNNCAPALIEWQTDDHPAMRLTDQGVRLDLLEVRHPEAVALEGLFAPFLDDTRVRFTTGDPGLAAWFGTPTGLRGLSG